MVYVHIPTILTSWDVSLDRTIYDRSIEIENYLYEDDNLVWKYIINEALPFWKGFSEQIGQTFYVYVLKNQG